MLLRFISLSKKLFRYVNDDADLSYLSTMTEAQLWRQLIWEHPELLDLLFNETDDRAQHFGSFVDTYFSSYWMSRRTFSERLGSLTLRRRSTAGLQGPPECSDGMTTPGTPTHLEDNLKPVAECSVAGAPLESHATPWLGAAAQAPKVRVLRHLVNVRDHAVVAHWLAGKPDTDHTRQSFKLLISDMARVDAEVSSR